jgi:putative ABC transport system permease protein
MILIIAIINFVNLAIAQGMKRAREVGIRKVMGAVKGQLIFQFLAEAFILTFVAVFLAMGLAEIGLPWFNSLTQWEVEANYLTNYQYIISILGIVLFVGFLAGGYPSFVLSKFAPSAVLKGDNAPKSGKSRLKTALVVTQFTVAIFMIISTIAVDKQIEYLKTKDLGFDQQDLMITDIPSDISPDEHENLRNELFKTVGVEEVSFAANLPGFGSGKRTSFFEDGKTSEDGKLVNAIFVDEFYFNQFKLNIKEGRNFTSEFGSDSVSSVILNETAAKEFGFTDPVGKTIQQQFPGEEPSYYDVIGVVEDYHYSTLHESIGPLVVRYVPSTFDELTIRLNTADLETTLDQLMNTLKGFNDGIPLWYYFLEDDLADTYETEEIIGAMLTYFTYLTIFIACLGLLGLVSFTIVNKKKEIGIRKVLGASVQSIVQNISYQFVRLVIVGFLIGAPLAYVLIQQWLNSFAYSEAPGFITFMVSGSVIIGVTLITIGYQTIRAAMANPVESLKSE